MATKTKGCGTSLLDGGTSGSSYSALTDLTSITPMKPKRGVTGTTTLDTAGCVVKKQGGILDPGQVTLKGFFTKTQFAAMWAYLVTGSDDHFWRITWPLIGAEAVNSKMEFQGFVSEGGATESNTDQENYVMAEFTIEVSGVPTFTAGT